nr:polyphosphate kinase 1 [Lachnospiraceae bacterium]
MKGHIVKRLEKKAVRKSVKKTDKKLVRRTALRREEKKEGIDFRDPVYYTNRELSWLDFNKRVLSEANSEANPLFERLKFLSITSSNLDEFFMVRIASLKDMVDEDYEKPDIAGMTPVMQLEGLDSATHDFVKRQYQAYKELLPVLSENGLSVIRSFEDVTEQEDRYLDRYFEDNVYPVLTPMAVDSSRPFPLIRNKTLNIGAIVRKKNEYDETEFVTVQVPGVLPRIVRFPGKTGSTRVMLLEDLIAHYMDRLFLNYDIVSKACFRITRNADFTIDEAEDLLHEIEKQIKQRQRGDAIRLEVGNDMDRELLSAIRAGIGIEDNDIYTADGPLDLTFLMEMYSLPGFDSLKEHSYLQPQSVPEIPEGSDIYADIREGDILMHHPYETFDPVVNFVRRSAVDSNVLAIKQTLYRVSGNSPIIAALAQAADNGKQVTVLVELKARFDEQNNIEWARMLEKAGCHVIYGLVGLKTHCKITLVVRREEDGIRRYVHLATGNYNDKTAKLYTDMGFFTCREEFGEDATAVFNMLSGYSEPRSWKKLSLAPLWLKDRLLSLIGRETENALNGRSSGIIAKMNSLCDQDVIEALYRASAAGVKIRLIIRGICCLKTG